MTLSKAVGPYLHDTDSDFYGPEYLRYIPSTSFEGKNAHRIGVLEVYGRYFTTDGNELKFEVPTGKGSHIYTVDQVYNDKVIAERQYTIDAVRAIQDYNNKISILLAQFT